jgi:hypothetical protein
MRRSALWVLLVLALAPPSSAVGVPPPASARPDPSPFGVICVTFFDAATGGSLPDFVYLDLWDAAADHNYYPVTFFPPNYSQQPSWCSDLLTPGSYVIRVRVVDDETGGLVRYAWYPGVPTHAEATPIVLASGDWLELSLPVRRLRGAVVSGVVTDADTGAGIPGEGCRFVEIYEADGVSLGIRNEVGPTGAWSSWGRVPAGAHTAVARSCSAAQYLDQWYRGPSGVWFDGYPGEQVTSGWAMDRRGFAAAASFDTPAGAPLTGIDFSLTATPTCRGRAPTIVGTTLADTISGTPGPDVFVGLAGNDTLRGLAGNDFICGNAGNDTLVGGAGNDTAVGGAGNDICTTETIFRCP